MKKGTLKSIILPVIVLAVVTMFMSSCQKGYGCPGAFHAKVQGRR